MTEAINDLTDRGFESEEQLEKWTEALRRSAASALPSEERMEELLREALIERYRKVAADGMNIDLGNRDLGEAIERFTKKKLSAEIKAELDKRIMASAQLIKLNRRRAIDQTLQRFSGWATSIPRGGTKQTDKFKVKGEIRRALVRLPFEERRVLIDQGHKLVASISEVIAQNQNAIAMVWHSNWRQPGYDYREDHKDRDERVYALKGSWAIERGMMKAGPNGFYEDITKVGEEPFCRCHAQWIYNVRSLPESMVTAKGRKALAEAKAKLSA